MDIEKIEEEQTALMDAFYETIIPSESPKIFEKQVRVGQAIISMNVAKSLPERWKEHQKFALEMCQWRHSLYENEETELVLGFFRRGVVKELSLINRDDEFTKKFYSAHENFDKIVIGMGCFDMQLQNIGIFPGDLDLSKDRDFGWRDFMGEHYARWNAQEMTFTRKSMSGRTNYCVKLIPFSTIPPGIGWTYAELKVVSAGSE